VPLNAVGIAQAQTLATVLATRLPALGVSPPTVFSSDLQRARQTAEVIALALGGAVTTHVALRERHYGVIEGLTAAEMAHQQPACHAPYLARDPLFEFGDGESLNAFAARVLAGLAALLDAHPGQTLLAVTHGGVLDVLYRAAMGRSLSSPRDFTLPNCATNWFFYRAGVWELEAWGAFPA
jgi:2,3-bisphosphoglycerate-dependent phosphoglycerate mutase